MIAFVYETLYLDLEEAECALRGVFHVLCVQPRKKDQSADFKKLMKEYEVRM